MSDARGLHADAVRLLGGWVPPTDHQRSTLERFVELLGREPGAVRRDHPGAHLTASAVVVHADLEQVLLCLHGRVHKWLQLGGHCEEGDATLAAAALREAWEESGITGLRVDPVPVDLDVHQVNCRYGASLHYDVRFAALAPPGAVAVRSEESHELDWFPADALPDPRSDSIDRLVAAALAAVRAKR